MGESFDDIFGGGDEQEEVQKPAKPKASASKSKAPVKPVEEQEEEEQEEEAEKDVFLPEKPAKTKSAPAKEEAGQADAEMANFLGAPSAEGHDLSVGQGPMYKFMQWVEADPKSQEGTFQSKGGFFLPEDQFPMGFTPERKLNYITFDNGEKKPGLGFTNIMFAILGYRLDWFSVGHDRKRIFYKSYDEGKEAVGAKGLRGRTRYVVLVKNDDLWKFGPIMLTVAGVKGRALQQAISGYDNNLRRQLERKFNRHFEPYRFWVPIKPGDRVKISEEYNKYAIPPALAVAEKFDPVELGKKAYVGAEVIEAAASYWEEVQEWAKASTGGAHGEPQVAKDEEDAPRKPKDDPFTGGSSSKVDDFFEE